MQIVKYGEWIRNIIFVHLSYEKLREMWRVLAIVYAADGQHVEMEEVYSFFNNRSCPSLQVSCRVSCLVYSINKGEFGNDCLVSFPFRIRTLYTYVRLLNLLSLPFRV